MKRKGEKSLSMVVTFIILLVVAGVVIGLVMKTFSEDPLDDKRDRKKEIKADCELACNQIDTDLSNEAMRSAIIDYCRKTFGYEADQVDSDIVYKSPLGRNSFCKDTGHCFNLNSIECEVNGQVIDAKMCRDVMCKKFKSLGLNRSVAEKKIESSINAGDCNLVKGKQVGDKAIEIETWWQEYFQDANCSQYY